MDATTAAPASSTIYTRTFPSGGFHTEETDGASNVSEYDFVAPNNAPGSTVPVYATAIARYQGAATGTPLLALQICYNYASTPCTTQSLAYPIGQINQYTTWNGIAQAGTIADYDQYGELTENVAFDFGTPTRPTTALQLELWNFTNGQMISDQLVDSGGYVARQTNYVYDGSAVQATSGVPQHVAVTGARNNATEIDQYISPNTGTSAVAHHLQYYDTGSVYIDNTVQGGTTTYTYDSTNTHPTTLTPAAPNGVSLASSATYDTYLGEPATTADANGTVASVVSSDVFGRPTEIDIKQSGTTMMSKSVASYTPTQAVTTTYQSSSVSGQMETFYDSYGRAMRTATQNGAGWYVSDTCYDTNGHVHFQSYPYSATTLGSQVCSGAGDTTSYDALDAFFRLLMGTVQPRALHTPTLALRQKR